MKGEKKKEESKGSYFPLSDSLQSYTIHTVFPVPCLKILPQGCMQLCYRTESILINGHVSVSDFPASSSFPFMTGLPYSLLFDNVYLLSLTFDFLHPPLNLFLLLYNLSISARASTSNRGLLVYIYFYTNMVHLSL